MSVDGEVRITRAERLRIPRTRSELRLAKLRVFKSRISDWQEPSPLVYDEPIIVTIKSRGIERTVDHFYSDVNRFEDLLSQKRLAGYKTSTKDAVLAYLLIFGHGSRHLIAGYLSTYPEFRSITPETVGQALSRLKSEGWIQ